MKFDISGGKKNESKWKSKFLKTGDSIKNVNSCKIQLHKPIFDSM